MISLDVNEVNEKRNGKRLRKVYYGHYDRPYCNDPSYPLIRIGGKYLMSYGFLIGDDIEVDLSHELIIIKKVNNTNED